MFALMNVSYLSHHGKEEGSLGWRPESRMYMAVLTLILTNSKSLCTRGTPGSILTLANPPGQTRDRVAA